MILLLIGLNHFIIKIHGYYQSFPAHYYQPPQFNNYSPHLTQPYDVSVVQKKNKKIVFDNINKIMDVHIVNKSELNLIMDFI